MTRTLHVFTGDAAAMTVRAALGIRPEDILIQHDVISCGPVRSFTSRDEWINARNDFWSEVCGGPALEEFPEDLIVDAGKLTAFDTVRLWVGAGLSDQLLHPTIVKLADVAGLALPPIEIASIASHRALSVPVLGWGMLRQQDIGKPAAVAVTPEQRVRAQRAWAGFSAQTPTSLLHALDLIDEDGALLSAMATLIERYPDEKRGLSYWDETLLASVSDAGVDAFSVVGGAIGTNRQWLDPVGDAYLFWRLRRLADSSLAEPLVVLGGSATSMRDCRVTPTEFGRAVRDGRASHVDVNGIDDWVGGVHLQQNTGSPWFRRGGELISRNSP